MGTAEAGATVTPAIIADSQQLLHHISDTDDIKITYAVLCAANDGVDSTVRLLRNFVLRAFGGESLAVHNRQMNLSSAALTDSQDRTKRAS